MRFLRGVRLWIFLFVLAALVWPANSTFAQALIVDHNCVGQFNQIPASVIQQISTDYRFYYGHTSHGSQLLTGMDMLLGENPVYVRPYIYEVIDDLGALGDVSWDYPLRYHLDTHPDLNVVMFSWCTGVSDNTEEGINIYLDAWNQLELDYPDVTFIYMTGHLDGTGDDGNLRIRNNQIRSYCIANGKVLYDFADIESYDPSGTFYPDGSDACEWCYDWCAVNSCPTCADCAHSHCFNCYLKGKAFWWMMARLSGWNPATGDCCVGRVGDANYDGQEEPTIGDISAIIDHLFIGGFDLACPGEADVNLSGGADPQQGPDGDITVGDLSILIDYLFITGPELGLSDCAQ